MVPFDWSLSPAAAGLSSGSNGGDPLLFDPLEERAKHDLVILRDAKRACHFASCTALSNSRRGTTFSRCGASLPRRH